MDIIPDRSLTLHANINLFYLVHSGLQAFFPAGFNRPFEHISHSPLQYDTASQMYGPCLGHPNNIL